MGMHQQSYPLDLADMAEWVRSATPPGGRVLDLGCGDGAMVERLTGDVDIVGIDPNAEPGQRVHAVALEDFDAEPFDVVFASLSLHHMSDPGGAAAALQRLTKPGSILLVREFDKDLISDEKTLRWWFQQRLAKETVQPDEKMPMTADFAEYVEHRHSRWYEHVHSWPVVEDLLTTAGFGRDRLEPMPFLFRWGLSDDIRPVEERLASAGAIRLTGVRWTGHRP